MKTSEVLERYVQLCVQGLEETAKVQTLLRNMGLRESFLFQSFRIGYSAGTLLDLVQATDGLGKLCEEAGLLSNGREALTHRLILPIIDSEKQVVNVVGLNLYPKAKKKLLFLSPGGIFNHAFLAGTKEAFHQSIET